MKPTQDSDYERIEISAAEIETFRPLSILLGHAFGHSPGSACLGITVLHCSVWKATPKALQLRFSRTRHNMGPLKYIPGRDQYSEYIWLPRRALVDVWLCRGTCHCELASWFQPDSYQSSVFDRFARHSFVSA